jgi:hypothetical protein
VLKGVILPPLQGNNLCRRRGIDRFGRIKPFSIINCFRRKESTKEGEFLENAKS